MKNKPDKQEQEPADIINLPADKDTLSQDDIQEGINTISPADKPHPALETPEGKNNGAEPGVFKNMRKVHP